jgi:hypothetical protein
MDMAKRGLPWQILLAAALLGASGVSIAKPAAHAAPAPVPAEVTTVDEIAVSPAASCLQPRTETQAQPPRVVSTFPANGATVRPGVLVLRVTFDQPMSCKGFFVAAAQARSPCPLDIQHWVLSFDRRTIRTVCHTELDSHYGLRLSDRSSDGTSRLTFVSLSGKRLAPYVLSFDTSSEPPINTASDSLTEDVEMREPAKDVPLKVLGAYINH